jgi:lincosamide nucleotidyltransferase A/C/D/E
MFPRKISVFAMRSSDVRNLCQELDGLEIPIWVDGGWAVDALLGEQSRPHNDLYIVIEEKDLSRLYQYLRGKGYTMCPVTTPAHGILCWAMTKAARLTFT